MYFAKDRWIADTYAVYYGEGVFEIEIDEDEYNKNLAVYEKPYVGTNIYAGMIETGTELEVPPAALLIINQGKRIWHP